MGVGIIQEIARRHSEIENPDWIPGGFFMVAQIQVEPAVGGQARPLALNPGIV